MSHPSESQTIRVVSWNIHKAIGGVDRRYDLSRVTDVLAEQKPHIALLQEVAATANEAATLHEAVGRVLPQVCRYMRWPLGHVYFYDPDRGDLRPSRVFYLADEEIAERFPEYRRALAARLPAVNEVSRIQIELLRRFRGAESEAEREAYKSALLLSINTVAAGLGATG